MTRFTATNSPDSDETCESFEEPGESAACDFTDTCRTAQRTRPLRDRLEQIYSQQRQALFSLALSMTGCRQSAEDAVQAAFERLCRMPADPAGELVNYVFAAVRNSARDVARNSGRRSEIRESIFNAVRCQTAATVAPHDEVLAEERDQILRTAVDGLDDDDREVVILKIYAEMTFEAIGGVLDVPLKTVASRYRRALAKLEEKLRGQL